MMNVLRLEYELRSRSRTTQRRLAQRPTRSGSRRSRSRSPAEGGPDEEDLEHLDVRGDFTTLMEQMTRLGETRPGRKKKEVTKGVRGGRVKTSHVSTLAGSRVIAPGARLRKRLQPPKPKTRPGHSSRVCVTTETRALTPLPRRPPHRSANRDREPKHGKPEGEARSPRPSTTASGAASSTDLGGFQEEHAVDARRFLLNLDPESFESGIDVVPAGRPLLPEYSSSMITETVVGYNQQDRVMMTLGFVRFIRLLMAEVMLAFERGVAAGRAREQEVLVDVEAEDTGDTMDLMQRTLTGCMKSSDAPGVWLRDLSMLQDELAGETAPLRNANICSFKARLAQTARGTMEQRAHLLAAGGDGR